MHDDYDTRIPAQVEFFQLRQARIEQRDDDTGLNPEGFEKDGRADRHDQKNPDSAHSQLANVFWEPLYQ
jgi:hypothetical protein